MATLSKKAEAYDGVRGAKLEVGTFTMNVDTVSGNSEAETTTSFLGVSSGDSIFLNSRQLDASVVVKEVRVTGTDEIGVNFLNPNTTDVDPSEVVLDYLVFKTGDIEQ